MRNKTNRDVLVLVVRPDPSLMSSCSVGAGKLDNSYVFVSAVDCHLAETVAVSTSPSTGQSRRAVVPEERGFREKFTHSCTYEIAVRIQLQIFKYVSYYVKY